MAAVVVFFARRAVACNQDRNSSTAARLVRPRREPYRVQNACGREGSRPDAKVDSVPRDVPREFRLRTGNDRVVWPVQHEKNGGASDAAA